MTLYEDTLELSRILHNLTDTFTVKFIKKDGTRRTMLCRLNVKRGIKGTGPSYDPFDYGMMTVFDIEKGQYRIVNFNTAYELKIKGEKFLKINKDWVRFVKEANFVFENKGTHFDIHWLDTYDDYNVKQHVQTITPPVTRTRKLP